MFEFLPFFGFLCLGGIKDSKEPSSSERITALAQLQRLDLYKKKAILADVAQVLSSRDAIIQLRDSAPELRSLSESEIRARLMNLASLLKS
jgi:hypothetical protein